MTWLGIAFLWHGFCLNFVADPVLRYLMVYDVYVNILKKAMFAQLTAGLVIRKVNR